RIGDAANTGGITVTAPIDPANAATLALGTAGAIGNTNAGTDVTVTNLALRSGGGITLDTAVTNLAFNNTGGAIVILNTGALTINAGFGDLDDCGDIIINGTISGSPINLITDDDYCVQTLNLPGQTVHITSVNGAILDCNDPPTGTLNVTADRLTLSAKTGI